ncbi:MAG: hypothetical protein R3E73_07830 [Porticoccaceae bacterium]|nr:hypothetical protein [Pseudomonadales bacterium]MCP5173148.1 hypothetical protein [Pseudomonadales bacterium]
MAFQATIIFTKFGCIAAMIAMILGLVSIIPDPYSTYCIGFGIFVLTAHTGEYIAVKAKAAPEISNQLSFFQTLIFGFSYWLPLIKALKK